TELYTKLVKWEKDRRFVVSRVLKPEKERAQLSLLEGSEYDYFGNDSNLLIVFYVQIMPDDFVMQLHRF
ncbi:alpha-mannosidase, partial [Klebsiella pneumoniae]